MLTLQVTPLIQFVRSLRVTNEIHEVHTLQTRHKCTGDRQRLYLIPRRVKFAVGRPQPVQEAGVGLPLRNLFLEGPKLTALQIKSQQSMRHQVKKTWGWDWGPQRGFGSVHLHGRTGRTRNFDIKIVTILPEA